ncbi:MAG: aldehyde dehydrogenase (NADP(+)) [Mariniblastus sp.]|nr:aldehyde dehydrogenase (NADP(+)) [Mariniblastus sp.]
MATHQVLINGQWRDSDSTGTFQANDPRAATAIPEDYPISSWAECEAALDSAVVAFEKLRQMPRENIADFLEKYADRIDARSEEIRTLAHQETALPLDTRLVGELGRTSGQLRQAAAATRSASWCMPVIDSATNIRSCYAAIGPVAVFGPNNFPLAFGSISGGDFAAAIAAGNPVIGKANSMHPGTTRLLAEEAQIAADETKMPAGTVQMIYRIAHADGEKLARDPRLAAIGYTGSRHAGLVLKQAADSVGKPIYLELSSVNPIVVLPGALDERCEEIADELTGSCLMGSGQFCTNPGMIVVQAGEKADQFIASIASRFSGAPVGTLFSQSGQTGLENAVDQLKSAGAEQVCGGTPGGGEGYSYANTVLKVSGDAFVTNPEQLQTEAFGASTLVVVADSIGQINEVLGQLEGNLTGCIYSAQDGSDDPHYDEIVPNLRQRVGRLLNDKMPTGVAVSPAMNHGGPFPATGHPGFTAVGAPGSLLRFSMLQCFDDIRPHRLPDLLKNKNPGNVWRNIDGQWTQADVEAPVKD